MTVAVNNGSAFLPSPPSTIPGQILAFTNYEPDPQVTTNTTSSTYADLDATNLAVTFTAPASGNVLVSLCASQVGAALTGLGWGIRESTTVVNANIVCFGANTDQKITIQFKVTGLTPGSSHTYKFAHARVSGAGTVSTRYGRTAGALDHAGPAQMTVQAL